MKNAGRTAETAQVRPGEWTFLTNHAHVLLLVARNPEYRIRDLAALVGITERAVQGVISDLEAAGYLRHERIGRRNRYRIHASAPMRHPVERHRRVAALIELVLGGELRGSCAASARLAMRGRKDVRMLRREEMRRA